MKGRLPELSTRYVKGRPKDYYPHGLPSARFPELKFVMRHGAEPWPELAIKLMLKSPNLYYMTSAFAPKHYPEAIINYANTRGAECVVRCTRGRAERFADRLAHCVGDPEPRVGT